MKHQQIQLKDTCENSKRISDEHNWWTINEHAKRYSQ